MFFKKKFFFRSRITQYAQLAFQFPLIQRIPQFVFVSHDTDVFVLLRGLSLSVGSLMFPVIR